MNKKSKQTSYKAPRNCLLKSVLILIKTSFYLNWFDEKRNDNFSRVLLADEKEV